MRGSFEFRTGFIPVLTSAAGKIYVARIREAFILRPIPVITFLFALGIGAHLHGRANQALPYVVSGSMGVPMLYPASESCRRPSNLGSAPRMRHADVLALLTINQRHDYVFEAFGLAGDIKIVPRNRAHWNFLPARTKTSARFNQIGPCG